MQYELYIDVFFLVNFMMDYILLKLVGTILKSPVRGGRICLGALLGAFLTSGVIVVFGGRAVVQFILFHGAINILMLQAALKTGWNKTFLKAYILLYISAFLVGGAMMALRQYIRVGSLFFALAVAGYYISLGVWNLLVYLAGRNARQCTVQLFKDEKACTVKAMADTGNCLRDTLTGKPVSIISRDVAVRLCGEDTAYARYIPYHSIGRAEGVMPLVALDKMCVCCKEEVWIEKPLAAVCEDYITASDYEMLLNPDLL